MLLSLCSHSYAYSNRKLCTKLCLLFIPMISVFDGIEFDKSFPICLFSIKRRRVHRNVYFFARTHTNTPPFYITYRGNRLNHLFHSGLLLSNPWCVFMCSNLWEKKRSLSKNRCLTIYFYFHLYLICSTLFRLILSVCFCNRNLFYFPFIIMLARWTREFLSFVRVHIFEFLVYVWIVKKLIRFHHSLLLSRRIDIICALFFLSRAHLSFFDVYNHFHFFSSFPCYDECVDMMGGKVVQWKI